MEKIIFNTTDMSTSCRVEFEIDTDNIIKVYFSENSSGRKSGEPFSYAEEWILHPQGFSARHLRLIEKSLRDAQEIVTSETNNSISLNFKLIFLLECIHILRATGRRFLTKPYLILELQRLSWTLYTKEPADILPAVALEVCEEYLRLCEADAHEDWIEQQRIGQDEDSELNREEEVEAIADALQKIKSNDSSSSADEITKKKLEQALERTLRWLLSRYNLPKAMEITSNKNPCLWRLNRYAPEVIGSVLLFLLFIATFNAFFNHKSINTFPCFRGCAGYLLSILTYAMVAAAVWKGFNNLRNPKGSIKMQVHLPRLASAIVVGYLVLLNADAWANIFVDRTSFSLLYLPPPPFGGFSWLLALGRVMVPLGLVWLYILAEMGHVSGIKKSNNALLKKSGRLWARGLAYSIIVGWIISDLFGEGMVRRVTSDPTPSINFKDIDSLAGVFGSIYPEVIFYLSPLALFIGVFVQLLWEDKPLTEKI